MVAGTLTPILSETLPPKGANTITVKDKKTAVEKTISIDAKKIAGFKVGEEVKVKTHGDITDVKVIKKHEGRHEGKHEAKKPEAPKAPEAAK